MLSKISLAAVGALLLGSTDARKHKDDFSDEE